MKKAGGFIPPAFLFFRELKGRALCFASDPVQAMLQGRAVDEQVEYFMPTGNVEEGHPDEDGEQPLAGEKQHDDPGKTEETPEAVSEYLDHQGHGRMTFMPFFHDAGMGEKIAGWGLGDKKGNEQQADQKGSC